MKKLLLLTAAVLTSVSSQANAIEMRQYVSLKGNYAFQKAKVKDTYTDGISTESSEGKFKDNTMGVSLAYGWRIGDGRFEVEGNLNQEAKDSKTNIWDDKIDVKTQVHSLMANAYYDVPTDLPVRPYVGAGIGLAYLKASGKYNDTWWPEDSWKESKSKINFAYQIGAGVSYDLTKNWTLDTGYRYRNYGKVTTSHTYSALYGEMEKLSSKVDSHNIYFGVRYTF